MKSIAVVTVTYECERVIEKTLLSVITQQNREKIQYIVIDGASKDGTLQILNKYSDKIDIIISEPDSGIYNAMNKALRHVNAEWVLFMNAGDVFYDKYTIKKIFEYSHLLATTDMAGFKTILKYKKEDIISETKSLKERWVCLPACHQSLMIKSSIHKIYNFDERWRICADHELFNKLINNGYIYKSIPLFCSVFSFDGISAKNRLRLYQEKLNIARHYNAPVIAKIKIILLILRLKASSIYKKIIGITKNEN